MDFENSPLETSPGHSKHAYFMNQALLMGEKALQTGETPVGCVLVYDDKIVGSGMNDTNRSMNGTRHAEFIAIQEMLQSHPRSHLRLTDLYVTVEPCVMCASALMQYQIRAVYFGCGNERFGGTGSVLSLHTDVAIDPPYPVHSGLFHKEAIMLLRRFYIQENEKAPKPRPKKNRELNTKFESKFESVDGIAKNRMNYCYKFCVSPEERAKFENELFSIINHCSAGRNKYTETHIR